MELIKNETMNAVIREFQQTSTISSIGFFLFIISIRLLTSNEGQAVHHTHSLEEAYNNVVTINPYEPLQREYDGRLIHISGILQVGEPITEPDYGISIQAVRVKRRVQMYQWIEEQTASDFQNQPLDSSGSNYDYITEWRDKLVDSTTFYSRHSHQNPKEMPLKTFIHYAPYVTIGPYTISSYIKDKFKDFNEFTGDERPENENIKLHLGIYYHCIDVWNPLVGDIRVQFYYAGLTGERVTIVAQQKDGVLVPYKTSRGHEIALMRERVLNVNEIFEAEHSDVRFETWKVRGQGVFVLFASVVCLSRLIKAFARSVPMLRSIFSSRNSMSSNLLLTLSAALIIISSAWIFYRPVLALGLTFIAISPLIYYFTNSYMRGFVSLL